MTSTTAHNLLVTALRDPAAMAGWDQALWKALLSVARNEGLLARLYTTIRLVMIDATRKSGNTYTMKLGFFSYRNATDEGNGCTPLILDINNGTNTYDIISPGLTKMYNKKKDELEADNPTLVGKITVI